MRAVVAALALVVLLPNMPLGRVPDEDEGIFLYTARVVADGGMPYRDVWDHKPPLIYLVDVAAVVLGGQWGVWAVETLVVIAAALLSYRALRPLGRLAASFGTVAWLLAFPALYLEPGRQTNFVELFALPLQFAVLNVFKFDRPTSIARGFTAGLLAGLAAALKPTVLGIWIALSVVIAIQLGRRGSWRSLAGYLALFAGGAATVAVLIAAWLATGGALAEAFEILIGYNAAYAGFPSGQARLNVVAQDILNVVPSGLAVAASLGLFYAVRGPRPPLIATAIVALPIELFFASAGRGYSYYFVSGLPSLALLAAFAVVGSGRIVGGRWTRRLVVGVVCLMAVYPVLLMARLFTIEAASPVIAAADYVNRHTSARDRVFLWGSRTEVLELARRQAPTRFVYQYAPFATRGFGADGRIDELVRDLERLQPVLVIDASAQSFATPPLDRAGFGEWRSPDPQYAWPTETLRVVDYVVAHYERVGTLPGNGWPVWRRRGT